MMYTGNLYSTVGQWIIYADLLAAINKRKKLARYTTIYLSSELPPFLV